MKAAYLVAPERLEIQEIDRPKIKDNEVLVKVRACAICGTDLRIYEFGHTKIKYPAIIGHEISGTVEEVGEEVREEIDPIKVGSMVMVTPGIPCMKCENCFRGLFCTNKAAIGYHYDGGFAEYMVVPYEGTKNNIFPLPENIDPVEFSVSEPLACAINGLERIGDIPINGIGLVIGAGSIGVMLAKLLQARGLSLIMIADINQDKLNQAQGFLGGDYIFINNSKEDLVSATQEITKRKECNIVVVACSSREMQELSLRLVSLYGKILYFAGLPPEDHIIDFDSNLLHYKLLSVFGTYGSTLYHNLLAVKLISSGFTKGIITHHFPLDQIKEAFTFALQGRGLKIIIEP